MVGLFHGKSTLTGWFGGNYPYFRKPPCLMKTHHTSTWGPQLYPDMFLKKSSTARPLALLPAPRRGPLNFAPASPRSMREAPGDRFRRRSTPFGSFSSSSSAVHQKRLRAKKRGWGMGTDWPIIFGDRIWGYLRGLLCIRPYYTIFIVWDIWFRIYIYIIYI